MGSRVQPRGPSSSSSLGAAGRHRARDRVSSPAQGSGVAEYFPNIVVLRVLTETAQVPSKPGMPRAVRWSYRRSQTVSSARAGRQAQRGPRRVDPDDPPRRRAGSAGAGEPCHPRAMYGQLGSTSGRPMMCAKARFDAVNSRGLPSGGSRLDLWWRACTALQVVALCDRDAPNGSCVSAFNVSWDIGRSRSTRFHRLTRDGPHHD